jgi:hypothetical protein
MADAIPTWLISQFSSSVEHLLQDKGGKLRSAVSYKGGYRGKQASPVNFIGTTAVVEVNERYGDTPNMDIPHERRWVVPRKFHWGKLVETDDELYTGIEPTGDYTQAAAAAFARKEDEVIIGGFWATAKTGETGAGSEAWSDTGYVVAESVGGSNTGMNLDKLRMVRQLFQYYHNDLDAEEIHMAITEEEEQDLLALTTVLSSDYVGSRPVQTGKLPPIMGINFHIFSQQTLNALTDTAETANVRSLPVWIKSGVHLGSWKERTVDVMRNPQKQMKPQIYMAAFYDCTRLQLGKVLKVKCYHS